MFEDRNLLIAFALLMLLIGWRVRDALAEAEHEQAEWEFKFLSLANARLAARLKVQDDE